jgi:hypothetical protein
MPTVPLHVDAVAVALTHAGLELTEAADNFRRNPDVENFDALLDAVRAAKRMIERAESEWRVGGR